MIKENLVKKGLAFGVTMLLIGTAIMASIDGSKVSAKNLTLNIYLDAVSINDAQHYDFVIISYDTFYEYGGEWDLERLADWHNQNDALTTYVVPISDIFSNSSFWVNGKWGDVNTDNPFKRIDEDAITNYEMFNDSAAKIRNYLRYANHELGVKYALLVGDTDSNGEGYFPARYVYARGHGAPANDKALTEYHEIIPTDVYYACLNGTFNADEDENLDIAPYGGWGENASESSDNIDECDWKWEIAIGRFPVDSTTQLSNAVRKTISYMSLSGEENYLHNITLGGTKGGWSGAAEWACNYSKIVRGTIYSNWWDGETTYGFNPSNYTISIIDDNPNRREGVDFTRENVENLFNSGCHIWYQNGHGNPTSWSGGLGYSWGVNDIQSLTNTKYCLVLSPMPCNTANFDNNDDCFMEQWLVDEHGAFASLGNTRYGWGSYDGFEGIYDGLNASSAYLGAQILDAYFNESYTRLGDMIFDSKLDSKRWHDKKGDGCIRWAMYEQILMGSPAVEMKLPTSPQKKSDDPSISNPYPPNDSINQDVNPMLSITVTDHQGEMMNVIFKTNASGRWREIGTPIIFTGNGSYTRTPFNMNKYETTYWWSVQVQELNSGNWTNNTYHFTTGQKMTFNPFKNGWKYYKTITIDHTLIENDLSNFPMLISITDTDLQDHAQSDGDDILFMNDKGQGTRLYHEIEDYDSTTGRLIAWVNVTTLSSTQDTVIYMYYGNKVCDNQQNPEMTWNNGYVGVWHLNHKSGNALDSTLNNLDGTPQNSPNPNVNCKIGKGVDFGNYGDEKRYNVADTSNLDVKHITVSCWAYATDNNLWDTIVSRAYSWQFVTHDVTGSPNTLAWWSEMDGTYVDGSQIIPNTWAYTVATIEDMGTTATLKFYINGKLDTTNPITLTGVDTGGDLYIGDWVGTGPGTQDWAGKLDEIRISRVDRNASWINTEYNNQQNPDTFIKLGNQVHRINQISMITNLSHVKVANGTIRISQSTRYKQSINSVFQWFLEYYSHMFPILRTLREL